MVNALRVAAIDVSHWHARYDAAWLPAFRDLESPIGDQETPRL